MQVDLTLREYGSSSLLASYAQLGNGKPYSSAVSRETLNRKREKKGKEQKMYWMRCPLLTEFEGRDLRCARRNYVKWNLLLWKTLSEAF